MQLHQRITNLVTKETDRLLKEFLNDNPDLLKRYVEHGMTALGLVLNPVNAFMRHLLVIQGLDPDTDPGEKQRQQLLEAVGTLFELNHKKDFDEDYDLSWVQKKFEETRSNMGQLVFSKDDYKKMTDISGWGAGRYPTIEEEQEYFQSKPSTVLPEKEIRVTPKEELDLSTKEGRQEYRERTVQDLRDSLKQVIKETAEKVDKFDPGAAIKKVEGIFEEINKISSKKGIKTSKKKVNKSTKKGPGVRVNRVPATVTEEAEYSAKKNTLKENIREKFENSKKLVAEMVERGIISNNADTIHDQVQQILLMDDGAVDALKNVVRDHAKLGSSADKFTGSFRRVQK